MNIDMRTAQATDAEIISDMVGELLQEIMAAIGSQVFSFDRQETVARARAWLKDGSYTIFLATDAETAVGFAALYESRALYAEGTFGTIPELYVRADVRSKGVGARLLNEVKQFAKAKGWKRLEVTTPPLPQFDRTKTFYERQGFAVSGGRKMKVDL
jgi:GNAT superfamily N-acetyltransferase